MLFKGHCVKIDRKSKKTRASILDQPDTVKERNGNENIRKVDSHRSNIGTSTGAVAPISRNRVIATTNIDLDMRTGAEEEAREDLMDQITEM